MHSRSQDKLDKDDPEKDKKDKRKEKRNSKHQEVLDKELRPADTPAPPSEAVILSETVMPQPARRRSVPAAGTRLGPQSAEGLSVGGHGICRERVTWQCGVPLRPPPTHPHAGPARPGRDSCPRLLGWAWGGAPSAEPTGSWSLQRGRTGCQFPSCRRQR